MGSKRLIDQLDLTVIGIIDPQKRDLLKIVLDVISQDLDHNNQIPCSKLKAVHYCRFAIIPGFNKGPDELVYSANYDGSFKEHLNDVLGTDTIDGFHKIFSCCLGFNHDLPHCSGIHDFILRHKKKVNTFGRGHRGFSLPMIKTEQAIYLAIQNFLNRTKVEDLSNSEIKGAIKAHVLSAVPGWKGSPNIELPFISKPVAIILFLVVPFLAVLVLSFLINIFLMIFVFLTLIFLIYYLRYLERTANEIPENDIDNFHGGVRDLTGIEDFRIQNQLTHVVDLRPGVFRRTLQKLVLALLNGLVVYTYNKGVLGGIVSIHFAQWYIIDRGKRLLFISNYDGNWESYIGDFIDRDAQDLTLAWSNTNEFPRTKWLLMDGATNEEYFKAWIRKYQFKTQVWYTAYKDLTVKNILRNHKIARGINMEMADDEIKEWLKLL